MDNEKLFRVLGADGMAELQALIATTPASAPVAPAPPFWVTMLVGALRSWTVWLGAWAIALPEILPLVSKNLEALLGPSFYPTVMQLGGIFIVLVRVKTNKPLLEKGRAE